MRKLTYLIEIAKEHIEIVLKEQHKIKLTIKDNKIYILHI